MAATRFNILSKATEDIYVQPELSRANRFAMRLLRNGATIERVQLLLRHEDIDQTQLQAIP
jgi:site-specific recombinase XerD